MQLQSIWQGITITSSPANAENLAGCLLDRSHKVSYRGTTGALTPLPTIDHAPLLVVDEHRAARAIHRKE